MPTKLRYMPAITQFLGCNPLAERLVRHRTSLGMNAEEAAREIGVDPATLARWERGEREPTGALLASVTHFLAGEDARRVRVRRAG